MSSIKGLNELLAKLNKANENLVAEVKNIIDVNIGDMEAMAYSLAPDGGDRIRTETGSISQDSISEKYKGGASISGAISAEIYPGGLGGRVMVDKSSGDISMFVEFGTGQSAKVYLADKPPEWKAYAMLFFVNGHGTIVNQPYLLPSFNKYSIQALKEIKQAMKDIKL